MKNIVKKQEGIFKMEYALTSYDTRLTLRSCFRNFNSHRTFSSRAARALKNHSRLRLCAVLSPSQFGNHAKPMVSLIRVAKPSYTNRTLSEKSKILTGLEYINSVNCHYKFNELPLAWLGLQTGKTR